MKSFLNWKNGDKFLTSSPYSFSASAILKDKLGKIIGARFTCSTMEADADVPIETLMEAFKINKYPGDDKEMRYLFLDINKYSGIEFSPWDNKICTINLRGIDYTHILPSIYLDENFIEGDFEYVTSFFCPKMALRFSLPKSTRQNIETINTLIYNTDFFSTFGIADVLGFSFVQDFCVAFFFRSYKMQDPRFTARFSKIAEEFCEKHGIPRTSIYNAYGNICFSLTSHNTYLPVNIDKGRKDAITPLNIASLHMFEDSYYSGFGVSDEQSLNAVYKLPNTKVAKRFGISKYINSEMAPPKIKIESDVRFSILSSSSSEAGLLQKCFRINENTFICLIGKIPAIRSEDVAESIGMLDECIYNDENISLLDECEIDCDFDVDIDTTWRTSSLKSIDIIRKIEIDRNAFGEINKEKLIKTIIDNFLMRAKINKIDAYCEIDESRLLFTAKIWL